MPSPAPDRPSPPTVRWFRRLAILLAVLAAHGLLLAWLATMEHGAPDPSQHGRGQPREEAQEILEAQVIGKPAEPAAPGQEEVVPPVPVKRAAAPKPPPAAAPPAVAPPPAAPAAAPPGPQAPPEAERQSEGPREQELRAEALPAPAASSPEPERSTETPAPREEGAAAQAGAAETGESASGTLSVPVYPTRLPPAFALEYELRRGALGGSGELVWQPGPPYLLKFEGRVPILGTVITQSSQGSIDAHGIAPRRFADRRVRRGEVAAHFDREAGHISFSGSEGRQPLLPGTQDRLSWMVQLAAIAEAAPQRVRSEPISLFVTSAKGDAAVWTFRYVGQGTLALDGRTVETIRLRREARRPQDTLVEVWLAPDAHHLPVRARQSDGDSEPFDLMLTALPPEWRK